MYRWARWTGNGKSSMSSGILLNSSTNRPGDCHFELLTHQVLSQSPGRFVELLSKIPEDIDDFPFPVHLAHLYIVDEFELVGDHLCGRDLPLNIVNNYLSSKRLIGIEDIRIPVVFRGEQELRRAHVLHHEIPQRVFYDDSLGKLGRDSL